jgi:ubiquinone/menaquinone biosynthesis C-methylase UbiE
MQLYSQFFFPRLLDVAMAGEPFAQYRRDLLKSVTGDVLEIGFGTGLNLDYYPKEIRQLATVDPNPGVNRLAQRRIEASDIAVTHHCLSGESLPMADGSFDSLVSTWVLCSIADVAGAIAEVHRVLRPGGRFFFIEHGLSNEPGIQPWQRRLTPLQKVIGDGCHLDRDIAALVQAQFEQVDYRTFYGDRLPKVAGFMYQGVATKA